MKLSSIINEGFVNKQDWDAHLGTADDYKYEYLDGKEFAHNNQWYYLEYHIPYNASGQFLRASATAPSEAPEIEKGAPELVNCKKYDEMSGAYNIIDPDSPEALAVWREFYRRFNLDDPQIDQKILDDLKNK